MNLTLEPEIVQWPTTHYVFIEKAGPFMQTARQAWQELHQLEFLISAHNQITGAMALYKMKPDTYRAGYILAATPASLPCELRYEQFAGGKYSKFVLTGSYSNLPQASGRVWEQVSKSNWMVRSDFAIENYANDPKSTPEDELITEILIPTE
ncbi:MAG: GyrI-like domain-containing protein [Terracidiphilus sp.]|jgi:DNA gyrase inhibitor GyrI